MFLVDSDLEFEESLPKQRRSSRARRQFVRQQNSQAKQNRKPSKQGKQSAIIIDEDDYLVIPDDSSCPEPVGNSRDGSVACSDTGLLTLPQTADVNPLMESSLAAVDQPRRAAKRGLAKQKHELEAGDSALPHRAAVYSQAVAGFKSWFHGADPEHTDPNTEDTGLPTTNGMSSELPDKAVSSDRATSESMSSCGQEDLTGEDAETSLTTSTSFNIQSPSPPPQLQDKRGRRMNKQLTKAFQTLNQAKISLNKITPPRTKGHRRDSDVIFVGEEDCLQKRIVVKVRYLTKVYRIQMKLNEPFHVLTSQLSRDIDEAEHNLGLFLHDRSLEATETPLSVNLTVADIIECHRIKVSEEPVGAADAIELVIQCSNSKSRITITANRRRPLSDVIQKYAQLVNAAASSFVFSFDGEDIEPTDTPSKLDMDDLDVIDVVYE
ncbi:hypothetical protein BsWGS_21681 [Bradybaena similaris]